MQRNGSLSKVIFPWVVVGLGALFYCYEYFLRIAPSVMKPELMQTFRLDGVGFGNLTAFYYYAYAPLQLVVGVLMDRYGPRILLTWACFLCATGSWIFGSSDVVAYAMVGRFLVGVGSAFAFVGALKLAADWLPPERFALVSGLVTTLGMLGAAIGDLVLDKLVHLIGWRHANIYSAIVGVLISLAIYFVVKEASHKTHIPEQEPQNYRKVFQGLKMLLSRRQTWICGAIAALLFLPTITFAELWAPPYLMEARGFTHEQAAKAVPFIFLGWAVGGPFYGWLSDYLGKRVPPVKFSSMVAFVLMAAFFVIPHLTPLSIMLLFFLFGLFSSVQVIMFAVGRELSDVHLAGSTVAIINMIVMGGGMIFQPLVGKVLDFFWDGQLLNGSPVYSTKAYIIALLLLPLGVLFASILSFFLKETYVHQDAHPRG